MKSIVTSLFCYCFFHLTCLSQITITSAQMPVAGDNISMADADTAGINAGSGGINQVWNFQSLTTTNSYTKSFFTCTNTISNLYSNINGSSLNDYYNSQNNIFEYMGWDQPSFSIPNFRVGLTYIDPPTYLTFPFSYGTIINDSYLHYEPTSDLVSIFSTKTTASVTTVSDGYGTIVLPSTSINNVLRIKKTEVVIDSTFDSNFLQSVQTSTLTTYLWLDLYNHAPLLEISYTTNNGTTTKKVTYIPTPSSGIKDNSRSDLSMAVFPNPFNISTTITINSDLRNNYELKIYDIVGKEIRSYDNRSFITENGKIKIIIERGNLQEGMYLYKILTSESQSGTPNEIKGSGKLIIE